MLLVTPQAVSRWETGVSYPDIAMIPEIVKVLKVSADELLGCGGPDTAEEREKAPEMDYPALEKSVQDSDFMRMMLTDILGREHHKVLQAKSGEEGLEILKGETCNIPVDVCILDIMMPGMNGLEVLEAIKRDYPGLKVIMLSAMCTEEVVKKALALGADGFVAKPFQASALTERI